MGEMKDKIVSLEGLQILYNMFANAGRIPAFDEQNESMALAIIDGVPQWTKLSLQGGGTVVKPLDKYYRFTNSMISVHPQKTQYGSATWTYNETTHDLSVTFDNYSEGILLYDSSVMTTGSEITVFFDSVEFSETVPDAALEYIGIYDNKISSTQGYNNTSGVIASWDGTNSGVQINTSSKYISIGGGPVPITVTYRNLGYLVNGLGPSDVGGGTEEPDTSLVASNVVFSAASKLAWSGAWNSEKTLYVELTTNQHTTNLGNVLSFGSNIGSWSGSTMAPHVHIYYPIAGDRSTIEVDGLTASNTTITYRTTISNTNELLRIACSKNGIYVNGTQMISTDITSFLNYYSNISTMQVGSQEGSNRYTGKYNEIRVFDTAYSTTELQNITSNGY